MKEFGCSGIVECAFCECALGMHFAGSLFFLFDVVEAGGCSCVVVSNRDVCEAVQWCRPNEVRSWLEESEILKVAGSFTISVAMSCLHPQAGLVP